MCGRHLTCKGITKIKEWGEENVEVHIHTESNGLVNTDELVDCLQARNIHTRERCSGGVDMSGNRDNSK